MNSNGATTSSLQHENEILKAEITHLHRRVAELEQQVTTSDQTINFLYQLLDTIPTPIFYKDAHGVYRGCNTAFASMLGHSKAHIIGKTADDIAPSDLAQRYHQADLDLIQQQTSQTYEAEVMHADGSRHSMLFHKAVFFSEDGTPGGLTGVMLDITAHKRAEAKVHHLTEELQQRVSVKNTSLKRQQALLETIINGLPAMIVVRDRAGATILANQSFAAAIDQTPQEIIGKCDDHVFTPAWSETMKRHYHEVFETGHSTHHELGMPGVESEQTLLVYHFPVRDEHDDIYAVGTIGLDITEHKRAERALYDNQQLLQTMFEHLPVAVVVKDAQDGRFVLWNQTSEALLGLRAEEVIGKTDYDFFPSEQADFFRQKDMEVLERRASDIIPEEIIDSKTLGQRTIRTVKVPVYDEQDTARYLLVIFNDITEQKRAAEERVTLQEQIIAMQEATIRELSTPLMPLLEGVVMMPIIGTIDRSRAQQMMETLLEGIAAHQARTVIMDITGMKNIDTQIAQALVHTAQAARLLGAQVILTGIQPQIATTLIHLGADLGSIMTRNSLHSGIDYVLRATTSHG